MGDLNIDLINGSSRGTALFTSLLESVGRNQIVTEATRMTVNTQTLIDVICTSNLDRVVSCNVKSVDAMSDHELIPCSLDLKKDTTRCNPASEVEDNILRNKHMISHTTNTTTNCSTDEES
nr:unnamed protein product [Callosobruchus analis]